MKYEMAPVMPPGCFDDVDPFVMMTEDWFQTLTLTRAACNG